MLLPKAEQELAGLSSSRIICKETPNYSALYRPRPLVSGYFWIRNVFFPRRPVRPHTSGADPHRFESALQGGKFWIRYMYPYTRGQ